MKSGTHLTQCCFRGVEVKHAVVRRLLGCVDLVHMRWTYGDRVGSLNPFNYILRAPRLLALLLRAFPDRNFLLFLSCFHPASSTHAFLMSSMRKMLSLYFLIVALLQSTGVAAADEFSTDYEKYNHGLEYGKRPIQTFVSNPDIIAPIIQVNIWDVDKISPTGGSHIFIRHDYDQSSPLILDASDLSVVYVDRQYDRTSDIRVQKNAEKSYLTFFSGSIVDGHGMGDGLVLDEHYNEVYKVNVQNLSVKNDLHEFQFTDQGTALVTAYDEVRMNLKAYRGSSRGMILDGVFQELHLETNEVLFQWRASDHVDLADSFYKMERKWDFFHINSVQKVTTLQEKKKKKRNPKWG